MVKNGKQLWVIQEIENTRREKERERGGLGQERPNP